MGQWRAGSARRMPTGSLASIEELTAIKRQPGGAQQPRARRQLPAPDRAGDGLHEMLGFDAGGARWPAAVVRRVSDSNPANLKAEFYLPTAVNALIREKQARVKVLPTESHWFGVNTREDRPVVIENIRALVRAGEYPPRLLGLNCLMRRTLVSDPPAQRGAKLGLTHAMLLRLAPIVAVLFVSLLSEAVNAQTELPRSNCTWHGFPALPDAEGVREARSPSPQPSPSGRGRTLDSQIGEPPATLGLFESRARRLPSPLRRDSPRTILTRLHP